ncbi:hypothetical protein ZWY2020_046859 [Hordeum vulgare]|nr:hypothetical protein ZWY2020_046859 [Hordeum vulgare]
MATSPPRSPNAGDRPETADLAVAAAPAQPARIWNSLIARLPTLPNSLLLAAASELLRRLLVVRRRRRRRRRPSLPLPIYDDAGSSARVSGEMPKAFAILEDIVQHTLSDLHSIQKSLLYWKSKAEGTNSHKMYFMIFERGPRAFLEATCQTLTRLRSNGSPSEYLLGSASDIVSVKLAVLTNMQHRLAAFLAEVYSEVDRCREGLTESSDKSLHTLFVILNTAFPKLEVSLTNASEGQTLPFTNDGNSSQLIFERLPEVDVESPQWSEALATDAISLIYQNLQKLDSFVSSQLSSHKKPRNMTIYWLPYTCGAIGLFRCSLWLLRHSSLMGSSDMDNWIQDAKESVAGFWDEHVERPVISIRDELFETFCLTDKRVMEREEVQLIKNHCTEYHKSHCALFKHAGYRMLITFCEQTSKEKLAQDASLQELLEIVMKRDYIDPVYLCTLLQIRKESMHPIQNLFSGELARAMLIQDQGAEGRGRIARHQRWQLLIDVERRLKEFKKCMINEMDEEASCKFGLTLYTLDRLYKAVEVHAKETGEWSSLRDDMFNLAKPNVGVADKLDVLKGLKWNYACLRPSLS